MPEETLQEIRYALRWGEQPISGTARVLAGPIRAADLLPVLQQIDDVLIHAAVKHAESQGRHVSCRPGCGACCRQMVPISETEARYLADLVSAMPEERRERVIARFADAVATLRASGLLEMPADPGERHRLGVEYFRLGLPCPFLEDESCSIHEDRPASCREYLVTSPAVNCSAPNGENIQMVELPAKLSQALYRFGDGQGEGPARWMPLPLLLEWAADHGDDPQPAAPGAELLRNFMNGLIKRHLI